MPDKPASAAMSIPDEAVRNVVIAFYDAAKVDAGEAKAAAIMTDDFLLRAYERTGGERGSPEAKALLTEIERRGLDA